MCGFTYLDRLHKNREWCWNGSSKLQLVGKFRTSNTQKGITESNNYFKLPNIKKEINNKVRIGATLTQVITIW